MRITNHDVNANGEKIFKVAPERIDEFIANQREQLRRENDIEDHARRNRGVVRMGALQQSDYKNGGLRSLDYTRGSAESRLHQYRDRMMEVRRNPARRRVVRVLPSYKLNNNFDRVERQLEQEAELERMERDLRETGETTMASSRLDTPHNRELSQLRIIGNIDGVEGKYRITDL